MVLDEHYDRQLPAVAYRDAVGALVRPAVPAAWTPEPVIDATEVCPACGAHVWEQITADDYSRGAYGTNDADMQPTPFVVCGACGHEEATVSFFALPEEDPDAEPPSPDTVARWKAEAVSRAREDLRERLSELAFTPRVVVGLPMVATGWGGSDGRVTELVTRYGASDSTPWMEVRDAESSPLSEEPDAVAQDALESILKTNEPWPRRSEAALALWLSARDRDATQAAASASVSVISLPVDGVASGFGLRRLGARWAAAAAIGTGRRRRWLILTCDGLDAAGLELRTVQDPLALLPMQTPEAEDATIAYAPLNEPVPASGGDRVSQLARDGSLARVAAELAALARPTLALIATSTASRTGETRVGGAPDLPPGTPWPRFDGEHGDMPFTFLAQVALDELPGDVWPGPRSGLLCIFGAIDADNLSIDRPQGAALIHVPAGVPVSRAAVPPDLAPELLTEARPATITTHLSVPGASVSVSPPLRALGLADEDDMLNDEDQEALDELQEELAPEGHELGQILGWPKLMQHDPLESLQLQASDDPHPYDDWSMLLQVDRDGTLLTVGLLTTDLIAGNLTIAEATVDFD
ncbi:hypothetical protein DSM112329_02963 [Paraconexibacter sp. AEG42_29]|uniref:DUF1963 domain-containing protein n=1 Tax=Paraconexibacter sp. AEG42_29 TaxID=2997339 RepID=A0AAU7AWU5_9ACTN